MPNDDGTPTQVAHPKDPRVQLAAERTFLAWVRTGLAMMAFGFVVARFAVYMQTFSQQPATEPTGMYPTWIGLGLVLLGVITELVAGIEYTRYCRSVVGRQRIPHFSWLFAMFTAIVLALLGIAIALYLFASA